MQSAAQNPSEDLTLADLKPGDELVATKPFGGFVDSPNFDTGDVMTVLRVEPEERRIVVRDSDGNEVHVTDTQIDMGAVSRQ